MQVTMHFYLHSGLGLNEEQKKLQSIFKDSEKFTNFGELVSREHGIYQYMVRDCQILCIIPV